MKQKLFLSCALAACCGAASAQSQVTLYGIVDTGLEYVTNTNAAGDSVVRMPSLTGSFPSRFGFRGTEDLGGGLSALFVLESGFATDGGTLSQGGRLFGRQAYVGLKNSYGSITLGRQSNMTYYSLLKSDVMGASIHAVTNMDTYLPNARSDNSIAYLGKFSELTVGATYSLGRDASPAGAAGPSATNCAGEVAGNAQACRQFTALLGYDTGTYGLNASYDIQHGNVGATNGLTSSAHTDTRSALSGYAFFGANKVGGGFMRRQTRALAATDTDLYFIGATVPFAQAWVFDAQFTQLNVKGTANKSSLAAARMTYLLSKRTALYTSLGYIRNRGAAALPVDAGGTIAKGENQAGMMGGIRHAF